MENTKSNFSLCDFQLQSPIIVGSGPLTYNADGIKRAHKAGAGAVVTKTIRAKKAVNPLPHIAPEGSKSLINAEKWSDLSPEKWIKQELPAVKEHEAVVVASLGHTTEEVEQYAESIEAAGADCLELVSYHEHEILDMIDIASKKTSLPLVVKISYNWTNPVEKTLKAANKNIDALTIMDSIGPVFTVNIENGSPKLPGQDGLGWLTGGAIRPVTQGLIARVAEKIEVPIIGLGGIMDGKDAIEMMMSGADLIGVCSALIKNGVGYIETLYENMDKELERLNYDDYKDIIGLAVENRAHEEVTEEFDFIYKPEICTECNKCVQVCPYNARFLQGKKMNLDEDLCRHCGYCSFVCPVEALQISR